MNEAQIAHLADSPLLLRFFDLTLRVEPTALGYGGFNHAYVLADFPQTRQIALDLKRDRVNAACNDNVSVNIAQDRERAYLHPTDRAAVPLPSRALPA